MPISDHDEYFKKVFNDAENLKEMLDEHKKESIKRIVISGANGFVGSELFKYLEEAGHTVYGFDNISNPWVTLRIPETQLRIGDIRDENFLDEYFKEVGPIDVLFHLAAQISVDESLNENEHYIDNNLIGTCRLEKYFYKYNPNGQFIFASTSEVYGSAITTPMDTNHPTNPQSPYAVSKLAADRYLNFQKNAYAKNIKICRMFNTYGVTQGSLAFIPLAVFSAFKYGKIFIFGDGEQRRDYIHVSRVAKRYSDMIRTLPGIYNFGTGSSFSINEIAEMIREIVNEYTEGDVEIIHTDGRIGEVSELISAESCYDITDFIKMSSYNQITQDMFVEHFNEMCKEAAEDDLYSCIEEIAEQYFGLMMFKDKTWGTLSKMVQDHYNKIGVKCE